jgi:mercuric ion binding protein
MRSLFSVVVAGLATVLLVAPASASDVEVKGPHICCGACVKAVGNILAKVDGVSGAKADTKTKTVTFTATDEKAAKAGFKALVDGGFFGSATNDGKELKLDAAGAKKGDKLDKVTVNGVHACCGQCKTAIKALFPDTKISYTGKGPQYNVTIEGSELYRGTVLEALRKSGFSGTFEK